MRFLNPFLPLFLNVLANLRRQKLSTILAHVAIGLIVLRDQVLTGFGSLTQIP
jgi:hypothetical protein